MQRVLRPRDIAHAREARGLKQAELAIMLGKTQAYLSMIENGRRRHVTDQLARQICRRLDLDQRTVFAQVPARRKVTARR